MEISIKPSSDEQTQIFTLFSGSTGNSVFIRAGSSALLIDAGMSARAIETALSSIGESLRNINAIFVTHEHTDHIRGLDVISRRYHIPVHVTMASAPYIKCAEDCLLIHPPRYIESVGGLTVSSFTTPHDSHGSVGYTVEGDGIRFGIATDLGMMTDNVMERLCECDSIVLESNHDISMLMNGGYPQALKLRILSRVGHLSNADCADSVVRLYQNGVRNLLLAHLSAENNRPRLALASSVNALEAAGLRGMNIKVADVSTPTRLV